MDVADDNKDVKLYRAAGDLLPELKAKLPQLVESRSTNSTTKKVRCWISDSKTEELIYLLNQFQEWPQLLDPHLSMLTQPLVGAFLSYATTTENNYLTRPSWVPSSASPLPRAVCRLLYTLCKVRGQKVIIRFLNNEPRYIEPMLTSLVRWKSARDSLGVAAMIWEERYIMLIWLSHLMLAPFDLTSVSSLLLSLDEQFPMDLYNGLPNIAISLLSSAWKSLGESSKEREAASILIVRLALRPDMQRQALLQKTVAVVMEELCHDGTDAAVSVYRDLGLLSILAGIMISGSDEDVASLVRKVFTFCHSAATDHSARSLILRNSAPARKLLIKIMRASLLHALSLNGQHFDFTVETVDPMVEDTIQCLLESLADKDTPVRLAASKALSVITLKLESEMAAEVVEAVVSSFSENMLYQQPGSTELIAFTAIDQQRAKQFRPSFGAVDPLRWHGLMLTLSHLLFRRSPPPQELPSIIQCLLSGLDFEQRSNVGSSVGISVRDAACFGIWAMSRKYTTGEINAINMDNFHHLSIDGQLSAEATNVVQLLAVQLVISSCLDPSGNIRRGSSAALQELIGRHPDTVEQGISLVQAADYHAVARRTRAMTEVATNAATMSTTYYMALLRALLDWRGSRATDAKSRRSAATAIGGLARMISHHDLSIIQTIIVDQLKTLRQANTGNNAEARHGFLLALAATIDADGEIDGGSAKNTKPLSTTALDGAQLYKTEGSDIVLSLWNDLDTLVGNLEGRITRELELTFEATSVLLSALARFLHKYMRNGTMLGELNSPLKVSPIVELLERCQTGSDKDVVVDAAAEAASNFFQIMNNQEKITILDRWLDDANSQGIEAKCRGRIIALGAVYAMAPRSDEPANASGHQCFQNRIFERLERLILGPWPIETKIPAMISVSSIMADLNSSEVDLEPVLLTALTDHTVDERGDVGSNLRLEGIRAVQNIISLSIENTVLDSVLRRTIQEVAKLTAEKLDKIRFQAWLCLQEYWQNQGDFPKITLEFWILADVSSTAFFRQLLDLLEVDLLREHIIQGIVSSAVTGSEDLGRASRSAIIIYMQDQDDLHADVQTVFLKILIDYLKISSNDDRVALSTMELLAFIIEQSMGKTLSYNVQQECVHLLEAMQIVHPPTSSLLRVEAALKIYSSLTLGEATRRGALERMTRMLLHRYPKIRNAVADVIFFHTGADEMVLCDWSRPIAELKQVVRTLRKTLGVV